MARRCELKSVASGIATSFISRNNDINGYWAIGILYKYTSESRMHKFTLNLLTGESSPEFAHSQIIAQHYCDYIHKQIKSKRFRKLTISSSTVEIQFNTPSNTQHIHRTTYGDPFICTVSIVDDLNKSHICKERGWCHKHNPNNEMRSARRNPYL